MSLLHACPRYHIVLFYRPNKANVGDVLVLTKPLGTHIACVAMQWLYEDKEKWSRLKVAISEEDAEKAYRRALASMTRFNRTGKSMEIVFPLIVMISKCISKLICMKNFVIGVFPAIKC